MKRPKVLSGQGFFILQKFQMLVYFLIRVSIEIHKLMEKLCHDLFIQKSNNLQTLEPGEDVREQKMVPLNLLLICTTKKVTLPNNQWKFCFDLELLKPLRYYYHGTCLLYNLDQNHPLVTDRDIMTHFMFNCKFRAANCSESYETRYVDVFLKSLLKKITLNLPYTVRQILEKRTWKTSKFVTKFFF